MHDPITFSLFLACISLVGGMLWILSRLPPLSSVETIAEKFVWRPTTAAHFKRDKELLVRYRQAYAWELFVGMTTLNIMLVRALSPRCIANHLHDAHTFFSGCKLSAFLEAQLPSMFLLAACSMI
jgi:hypothetical protein